MSSGQNGKRDIAVCTCKASAGLRAADLDESDNIDQMP